MRRSLNALASGLDLLCRALALQGIWLLGTAAGGIVLGWAPATLAAVDAAERAERGEPIRLGRAVAVWRAGFLRSQVFLGIPGLLVLAGLLTATTTAMPLVVRLPAACGAIALLAALLHVPSVELRHRLPTLALPGRSAVLALAQLPTTLLMSAVLLLWAGILASAPGLIPFLGAGVPLLVVQHLVARSLERNARLLAEQSSHPAAPGHAPRPTSPRPRRRLESSSAPR